MYILVYVWYRYMVSVTPNDIELVNIHHSERERESGRGLLFYVCNQCQKKEDEKCPSLSQNETHTHNIIHICQVSQWLIRVIGIKLITYIWNSYEYEHWLELFIKKKTVYYKYFFSRSLHQYINVQKLPATCHQAKPANQFHKLILTLSIEITFFFSPILVCNTHCVCNTLVFIYEQCSYTYA